ncbi:MAG: hypothetical protein JNL56_03230 [Alphaproteobacteria bacterium]|nr:hypothetical protein [Alphaproteobacteria bacterium]
MDRSTRIKTLAALRTQLAGLDGRPVAGAGVRVALGAPAIDATLDGGLARGAVHEIYAARPADAAAAAGFTVGLAIRAAGEKPIVWVRQDFLDHEAGRVHPPGLADLGLDPGRVLLVRAKDIAALLRASGEALRCAALGAVLMEPWGVSPLLDLTTSRRLGLAAEESGVPALLLRVAADPAPSAAATRWRAAAAPSAPLEAGAPGHPAFDITLERRRGGAAGETWAVEWNRELGVFRERPALSGAVVSLPAGRPHRAGAPDGGLRRAG